MKSDTEAKAFFFISDLHIGGDGRLNVCHFENELIQFLEDLARRPGPTELIIIGDCFGLWEMPSTPVEEKIPRLAETHPLLFEQFRIAGEKIRISLIPGNHDHEMTWAARQAECLRNFNLHLEPVQSISREMAGRRIWIEHGNQHDPFNRFEKFGNRFATPFGYYVTSGVSARAGRIDKQVRKKKNKKTDWIQDLESVYPNEDIPLWIVSCYFFRELAPLLRWIAFPFLAFFTLSVVIVAGTRLEQHGVIPTNIFRQRLGQFIGFPGKVFDLIVFVNEVVILLLLAVAVPLFLLALDFRRTLRSYGIDLGSELKVSKDRHFVEAATKVFDSHPEVAVYIYGHTHIPSLKRIGQRCIINTGTWLKRLVRTQPFIGLFPPVFLGSYHLNYFQIDETATGDLRIGYHRIHKPIDNELTLMERFLILGRKKEDLETIPAETILPGGKELARSA